MSAWNRDPHEEGDGGAWFFGLMLVLVVLAGFLLGCSPLDGDCLTHPRAEIVGEVRQHDTIYVEYRKVQKCFREVP